MNDEDTKKVNEQLHKLYELCDRQTIEQIAFLRKHIKGDSKLDPGMYKRLMDMLNAGEGFKLKLFQMSTPNALEKVAAVQIIYDVDDDLFAYLKRPESELPRALVGFLDGGIDMTRHTKDAAIDQMPQTGKTKV